MLSVLLVQQELSMAILPYVHLLASVYYFSLAFMQSFFFLHPLGKQT
jgi:hypothetical protein